MGIKHCEKRRKCLLPAFYPFSTMFSKAFFLRVVKCHDSVVQSFNHIGLQSTCFNSLPHKFTDTTLNNPVEAF